MKKVIFSVMLVLSIASSSYADGFDGFFASLGIGTASTKTDFKEPKSGWSKGESDKETGIATSFKVGYGFEEDFAIYLFRDSSFVNGYENDPDKSTYGNCITGLGVILYIDDANIFYTFFGMGEAQFTKLSEADSSGEKGGGYVLGLGVNLFEDVTLELSTLGTEIDDSIEVESESTRLTLNYYWY